MKNTHKWEKGLLIAMAIAVGICLALNGIRVPRDQATTATTQTTKTPSPTAEVPPVGPQAEAIIERVAADKKDQLENISPETAKKLEDLGFSTTVHKIVAEK